MRDLSSVSRLRPIAALAITALLAACSGGGGTAPTAAPTVPIGPQAWSVQTGASSQQEAVQGLEYYPQSLTINVGDTVTWNFPTGEPHTVSLPVAGQGPSSLPAESSLAAQQPAGTNVYDGSTFTSSGFVLLGGKYTLTFAKAGVYKVYCIIHQPEMVQTITVNPVGTAYAQTQTTLNTQAQASIASDLSLGQQSVLAFPYPKGGTHLVAGISPGLAAGAPSTATVLRFLNADTLSATSVTVSAGSTVVWTNQSNNAPHTVTFAPVGQPFPELNPFSPPSGGNVYDGTKLVNSGPMFPGQSFSVTLTKPGTYTYHCIFHDDTENMIGTVVVI